MIDVIYGIPKLRTCNVLKEKEEKKDNNKKTTWPLTTPQLYVHAGVSFSFELGR